MTDQTKDEEITILREALNKLLEARALLTQVDGRLTVGADPTPLGHVASATTAITMRLEKLWRL